MPDEVVSTPSADPIRAAIESSVADAGLIDASADAAATPPAESATPATEAQPDASATPPAPKAEATPPAKTEEEELAEVERGLIEKNPSLRQGQMSMSRHQAVLTRRANEHKTIVDGHEKTIKELREKYENEATQDKLLAFELAEAAPQVFFDKVLKNDPRYTAIFDSMVDAAVKEAIAKHQPATPPAPAASAAPAEKPKPDALLPDGSLGYSAEGALALAEWVAAQQTAALEKKLEEKFGAIDKDLAPSRDAAKTQAEIEKSFTNMSALLTEARRDWPNFSPNEKEIRAELGKPGNERLTLRQAYDRVVYGKLTTDLAAAKKSNEQIEAEVRARLIAETNAAAAAAGRTPQPGKVPAATPKVTTETEDPIRAAVARSAATLRA